MPNRLVLNKSQMTRMLTEPGQPVHTHIMKMTLKVHGTAVRLCPVDQGRLRSSIRWSMNIDGRGVFGLVGTDVSYAIFVHEGTKPHTIVPINKRVLFWTGASHPVKRVRHPGTRPRPFLRDALKVV